MKYFIIAFCWAMTLFVSEASAVSLAIVALPTPAQCRDDDDNDCLPGEEAVYVAFYTQDETDEKNKLFSSSLENLKVENRALKNANEILGSDLKILSLKADAADKRIFQLEAMIKEFAIMKNSGRSSPISLKPSFKVKRGNP